MKAPSPAFSFYPKDILSDEAAVAMTDEELGIYVRLLCHAWLEGSIPADLARLARMNHRGRPAFERLWRAIAPCWRPSDSEPGRLIQGRLEHEREKQRKYSEQQSARARRAGRDVSPKESTNGTSRGRAAGKPRASRKAAETSLPSPSPSPSSTPTTTTDNGMRPAPPAAGTGPATWLTPYGDEWQRRWGEESEPPWGEMAKALRPAHKKHGDALVGWWAAFLAAAERAEWARPARFIQGLGQWAGTARPAKARSPTTKAERLDAKVSSLLREAQAPGGELPWGGEGHR